MAPRTSALAKSPLFQNCSLRLSSEERVKLSYARAIAIGKAYELTVDDVMNTTPKFWELQEDPILLMDGAAATLVGIHLNLCTGTLARHIVACPERRHILDSLLNFEIFGQFCLTEQGHGLDARNLETTATVLADGSIDLHTPSERAAKHMPPTSPCGIATVAVVFARLIVEGESRGVKPFIVHLHDGYTMSQGITSRVLTDRGGSVPVNHCLTYFNHVKLPANALLGSLAKGIDERKQFFDNIHRVIIGTLVMAQGALLPMKLAVYVAGRYSQRRLVTDSFTGKLTPIISFPTQQYPVLATLAQVVVYKAFLKRVIGLFNEKSAGVNVGLRHCLAAIAKATLIKHCCSSLISLSDRCGAQGLFEVNQLTVQHATIRGAAIAEGDILTLCVRFGVEILIGRIPLPPSTNSDTHLARRESSMIKELQDEISSRFKHHRDPEMQTFLLPQCQPLIEAIGYRMAFDAAVHDGVDQAVLDMFVASIMREDRGWFTEVGGVSRAKQMEFERKAMAGLLPLLDGLVAGLDMDEYCTAPIVSEEKWDEHVKSMPVFSPPANVELPVPTQVWKSGTCANVKPRTQPQA